MINFYKRVDIYNIYYYKHMYYVIFSKLYNMNLS
jgi:hypothetical protein